MTERSIRRAAEMAIINAAYNLRRAYANPPLDDHGLGQTASARMRLELAVAAHERLGLAAPTGTPTSHNAPQTSHDAAEWLKPRAKSVVGLVFADICWGYRLNGRGMTSDQVQQRLGLTHQTCSPRFTELRQKGYIVDSGFRERTRKGHAAIVWKPTVMGLAASYQVWTW